MKRRFLRTESCIAKCLAGILIFTGVFTMMSVTPISVYAGESGDPAVAAENAQTPDPEISDPAPAPEVSEPESEVSEPEPEVSEPAPAPELPEAEPVLRAAGSVRGS